VPLAFYVAGDEVHFLQRRPHKWARSCTSASGQLAGSPAHAPSVKTTYLQEFFRGSAIAPPQCKNPEADERSGTRRAGGAEGGAAPAGSPEG
jgi:hypothetical protein